MQASRTTISPAVKRKIEESDEDLPLSTRKKPKKEPATKKKKKKKVDSEDEDYNEEPDEVM